MSVVLVIEPDRSQAEVVRRVLQGRVRADLALVQSTKAAIEAIDRRLPDLILLSALLSPRDEKRLIAHLRTLDASHLQTLTLPQFGQPADADGEASGLQRFRKKKKKTGPAPAGADPAVFAEEIDVHLARAAEMRSRPTPSLMTRVVEPDPPTLDPPLESVIAAQTGSGVFDAVEPFVPHVTDLTAPGNDAFFETATPSSGIPTELAELAAFNLDAIVEPATEAPVRAQASSVFDLIETVEAAPLGSFTYTPDTYTPDTYAPDTYKIEEEADDEGSVLTSVTVAAQVIEEPEDDGATIDEPLDDEIERIARQLGLDVAALNIEDASGTPVELSFESDESDGTSEAVAAEVAFVQAEAEARLAAELERVSAEAEGRRLAELAKLKAEADAAREAAIEEARALAEREARESMADEVARVRTETEGAFAANLARVRDELEQTLSAQLNAARSEAERLRAADSARAAAEAEALRLSAAAEARAAAEREAREALAAELGRVRTEAEGTFAANLARVRSELEETLSAQLEAARTEAERLRAAESARAEAEAEAALRQKAAADARLSSEAARARALEAEIARVKEEAEARLQSELERARKEAASARLADESHARKASDHIREAATREARAIAEEAAQRTLEMEVERVRVQADAVLETELAKARAESQNRRAVELQEIRAQMTEMRETATREARAAAAEAVATEVKRAAKEGERDYYSLWQTKAPSVEAAPPKPVVIEEEAPLVPFEFMPWMKWGLPSAAVVMLGLYTGIPINAVARLVAPSPKPAAVVAAPMVEAAPAVTVVEKTRGDLKVDSTPSGAKILIDGRDYGETPRTISDLKQGAHTLVLQSKIGSVVRRITIRPGKTTIASEAIFAGWLAVFSSIPLDISLDGKSASPTDDGRIMAPPGTYDVVFSNARFNYRSTARLEIRPGEITAHTVAVPSGTLHVAARDGAEIRVDGEVVGHAPLGDLPVPIGTHEVTATHPEGGSRRATVDLRYGEVTETALNANP